MINAFKRLSLMALATSLLLLTAQISAVSPNVPVAKPCRIITGAIPQHEEPIKVEVERGAVRSWYSSVPQLGVSVLAAFSPQVKMTISNISGGPLSRYALFLTYTGAKQDILVYLNAGDTCYGLKVGDFNIPGAPIEVKVARLK